jgi:hypothetical protein
MKKMFTTLAIGLMLAGCGSHEEPTPPVSSDPVIGSPTGPRQDNPCPKGPNGDVPCVDDAPPVATEAPADAPVAGKPDIDVGGTVKPAKE